MSIQAVSWVLENSTTKGAQRLVLIALANHADEAGECWPSIERIANEANVTAAHAKRTIAELDANGHLARSINKAPDERMRSDRRTNLYLILGGGAQNLPPWLERGTERRASGGQNGARAGGGSVRERGGSDPPPNHHGESSLEPSGKPSTPAAEFEAFWLAYPKARRTAKPDARAAFLLAVKKVPAEQIIEAARRYTEDPNRVDEYTPYPQKWLKQERWNAPPEPRRGSSTPSAAQLKEQRSREARERAGEAATRNGLFSQPAFLEVESGER